MNPNPTTDAQLASWRARANRLFDVTASYDAGEITREPGRSLVAAYHDACREIERLEAAIWLRDGALAFSGMNLERLLGAVRESHAYWTARHPQTLDRLIESGRRDYQIEGARCDSEIAAAAREIDRLQAAIYVRATTPRKALSGRAPIGDRTLKTKTPGITRLERATVQTTEPRGLEDGYIEREYDGYRYRCNGCGLVWEKKHLATECESRKHVTRFEVRYGGRVENGRHIGYRAYTRAAVRRETVAAAAAAAAAAD